MLHEVIIQIKSNFTKFYAAKNVQSFQETNEICDPCTWPKDNFSKFYSQ